MEYFTGSMFKPSTSNLKVAFLPIDGGEPLSP